MEKETCWIGGRHAVEAAILNSKRQKYEIIFLDKESNRIDISKFKPYEKIIKFKNEKFFNKIFPTGFKHQGIAAKVSTIKKLNLKEFLISNFNEKNIVLLDGVTDPRNIGSIIRNCVGFNIETIILHEQGLNLKSPTLHNAASGAIEHIKIIVVKNIFSSLKLLKENNFWILGFDSNNKDNFDKILLNKKNVLIFGDEGSGMKKLTKDSCDNLVSIPTSSKIESLNVSSAVVAALCLINN